MEFRLTTDKGNFISLPERRIAKIDSALNLSMNLVHLLFESEIEQYPDDIQSHAILLRQMLFELMNEARVKKDLTVPKQNERMDSPEIVADVKETDATNVVSFDKFKKGKSSNEDDT